MKHESACMSWQEERARGSSKRTRLRAPQGRQHAGAVRGAGGDVLPVAHEQDDAQPAGGLRRSVTRAVLIC
jgi:hypothetical protein